MHSDSKEASGSVETERTDPPEALEFENLLEFVGSEGKFQKILLYGFLGPLSLVVPLFMYNVVFMFHEPDHWCHVPGQDNITDLKTWKNLTIPLEYGIDGKERFSHCLMYSDNGSKIPCQYGWDYDRTDYENTMVSQFNWVCDRGHYATYALTSGSIGNALGATILGQTADKLGRKPILFVIYFGNVLFRVTSLFIADNYFVFLGIQIIHGMAFPLTYIVSTMLVCEVSSQAYRAWIYSFTWIIWVVGFSLLPVLAWLTRTWLLMGLVTSLPGILLMLYWWLLPESPRWLVSRGNFKDAQRILERIAEWNGKTNSLKVIKLESLLQKLCDKNGQPNTQLAFLRLFSRFRLARNTVILAVMWSTNFVVNLLIMLVTHKIPGDQFVNFFILGVVEIPASYLGGFLADRIGRRWTQVVFFTLCALSCVGTASGFWFVPDSFYLILGCAIVAKFAITVTFIVMFIQVTEMYPTELRSTGSGFASTIGSIMNIFAPYIAYFGKIHDALPFVFLAGISIATAMSAYFLPETLNEALPESLEDANNLGKEKKEMIHYSKNSEVPQSQFSKNVSLVGFKDRFKELRSPRT